MKSRIGIIIASIRDSRNADTIVEWIKIETKQYNGDLEFEVIDLKDWDVPHYTSAKIPAQRAYDNDFAKKWSAQMEQYDGFIVVTPEYNHSYPGVLKDAFDHLFHEWVYKPITFIGYGTQGGVRAIEHLRLMSIQLAMAPIRRQITIPIWEVLEDGAPIIAERFHDEAQELFRQLEWWTISLSDARKKRDIVL
ncbi:MAG TPA: NAD(P)H-dependent oxidoreductase [Candidatus Saccharimonadales bacterium]|nr:NAD(P)H-dependent oxidoreductase [Candidatus Saccharimonadales bacterium]